nr:LamG domain-containing protein [Planotetraspora mira]
MGCGRVDLVHAAPGHHRGRGDQPGTARALRGLPGRLHELGHRLDRLGLGIGYGLRVAAADESDPDSWTKFYSADEYSGADEREPRLIITYNDPPSAPGAADLSSDPGGACATDSSAPALSSTATPNLTAVLRDPDNRVGGTIEWWDGQTRKGGRDFAPITNSGVSSGLPFSATVPSGAFTDGRTIAWRARSSDENATSDWSGWCYLKVATATPQPPTVSSADYPDDGQAHGGVGRPGDFTFTAGSPNVVAYEYTFVGQAPVTASVAPGDPLTITWAPTSVGTQTLEVRNRNVAGRWSSRVSYRFSVAADGGTGGGGDEATLSSYWPFDEGSGSSAANAVPGGPSMTLRSGATWQPSPEDGGPGGWMGSSNLVVDAQSGGYADAPGGVVSTDGSFSVMAWARQTVLPQTPDDRMTVVSRFGGATSGFSIEERVSPDDPFPIPRWALVRSGGAADGQVLIWSDDPVSQWGDWTHITAVYDAANHTARLYVNGQCSEAIPGVGTVAGCAPVPVSDPIDADGPITVGSGGPDSAPGRYFSGDIDEVRLYDGVVSETEIAQRQGS